MSLSKLEVLSEGLVSAPPVEPDHAELLVSPHLMEVRVSHVVLFMIGGHPLVVMDGQMSLVHFSKGVSPMGHHVLLLVSNKDKGDKRGIEMEPKEGPNKSDSVLGVERLEFPVSVGHRVLEEPSDIFEGSPFLGHVPGLVHRGDHLVEVAFCFFRQSSVLKDQE